MVPLQQTSLHGTWVAIKCHIEPLKYADSNTTSSSAQYLVLIQVFMLLQYQGCLGRRSGC